MANDHIDEAESAWLTTEWRLLTADLGLDHARSEQLGREMLERWGEPHRGYHDLDHLTAVLGHLTELAAPSTPSPEVRAAAWFHDAIYAGRAGDDEEASAQLAEERLAEAGLDAHRTGRVADMVRATAGHLDPARAVEPHPDTDLLLDADLAILASDADTYAAYVAGVRAEHPDIDDATFTAGRTAAVRALLSRAPLFRTSRGRALFEDSARANLTAELRRLDPAPG